jgi:hypothetical protein
MAPVLADPPMATCAEMEDGTYSLDDVLKMNLMLGWKAKKNEARGTPNTARR